MILRTTLILRTHIERGINVKKTLLAASVATAMLPVGAMAAPTFYGKLNLSVDKNSDYPDTALGFSQDDLSDAWFVSSNNSRLGVKGELGNVPDPQTCGPMCSPMSSGATWRRTLRSPIKMGIAGPGIWCICSWSCCQNAVFLARSFWTISS